jgi:hypothetical protein
MRMANPIIGLRLLRFIGFLKDLCRIEILWKFSYGSRLIHWILSYNN